MSLCVMAEKVMHQSHDAAERAAGEFMEPYLCRSCLKWHVGHSKTGRKKERRRHLEQMMKDAEALGLYDQPEISA